MQMLQATPNQAFFVYAIRQFKRKNKTQTQLSYNLPILSHENCRFKHQDGRTTNNAKSEQTPATKTFLQQEETLDSQSKT